MIRKVTRIWSDRRSLVNSMVRYTQRSNSPTEDKQTYMCASICQIEQKCINPGRKMGLFHSATFKKLKLSLAMLKTNAWND